MSAFTIARDELPSPSPQKRPTDDGDSGYHEMIDDAAAFELLPPVARRSSSPIVAAAGSQLQILQQQKDEHVGANGGGARANDIVSADSAYTTPEYSPISPTPRPLPDTESVSSSASTQPDAPGLSGSASSPDAQVGGGGVTFLSPSPSGSEEDVSGKGEDTSGFI